MARFVLTAATETPREEGEATERLPGPRRFHSVIAVEETWTGDGRFFKGGAFVWRDLPLPLMADATNHPMHLESRLVGNYDTIERIGFEIHGWGAYVEPDLSTEEGREVKRLQDMIDRGELRGISADMDDPEWEVIIPVEMMDEGNIDDDGNLHFTGAFPKEVYSSVRIIGATALPFPAIEEAYIEGDPDSQDALTLLASAQPGITGYNRITDPLVASAASHPWIKPPVCPPLRMFDDLDLDGPTPLTLLEDGEYFGHLALWGTCHLGRAGCVTPPASKTDYAYFHLGEVVCEDGSRVAVGRVTIDGPHANLKDPLAKAAAHYDNTTTQVAHVRAGEDDYGIWIHGCLLPDVTPAQVRKLMASPPSGDWRRQGPGLELVAVLDVNVPGFPVVRGTRAKVYEHDGLVASLIMSQTIDSMVAGPLEESVAASAVERIARSIGRAPHQRIAQLRDRVHGRTT